MRLIDAQDKGESSVPHIITNARTLHYKEEGDIGLFSPKIFRITLSYSLVIFIKLDWFIY